MKSIMQDLNSEVCYICGKYAKTIHHCWHGTANRKLADKDGLTILLCHSCHSNLHDKGAFDKDIQTIAQLKWMEHYGKSVDDFRKRYGKSLI